MIPKRYSRLAKVEEKRNVRSAVIFGGLTILIILLTFLYGVPVVARFSSLLSGIKGGSQIVDTSNLPPPPPPQISTPPQFTNQQNLHIDGTTQPDAGVNIFFNDQTNQVTADSDGKFSGNFSLIKGTNTIYATAKNKGGTSEPSTKSTIVYDTEPPKLEINSPKDGDNFYGDKQKQLTVQGTTDPEASVTINGRTAIVENDGTFQSTFNLNPDSNSFTITATDKAGNKKDVTIKVNFTP